MPGTYREHIEITLQEQIEAEKQQLRDAVLDAVNNFTNNTGLYIASLEMTVTQGTSACRIDKHYKRDVRLNIVD